MRERLDVPEELLRACLREQYDLSTGTIERTHMSWDSMIVAYHTVSAYGTPLLLRAKLGSFYEPSCLAPRYLQDQGISAVVAPLRTQRNALWVRIGDWTFSVYRFIEGEVGWRPAMTEAQWRSLGTTLGQIHRAPLPLEGMPSLQRERFDAAAYVRQIQTFAAHFDDRADGGSQSEQALRSLWMEHQSTIYTMVAAMETLAKALQGRSGPFVICHADLHPGNVIRDRAGQVHVIDWDDVMLAPKERDFLFVGDPRGAGTSDDGTPSFFQGYGPAEIDWVALTYYRFERIVTDLIECAHEVLFRDDLGEDARTEAVHLFGEVLAPRGMVVAARTAAAHLPADLRVRGGA